MSAKRKGSEIVAVLAGAVIGTLVAGCFAWLFADAELLLVVGTPAVYVLALATVALFAAAYRYLPPTPAVLASLVAGVVVPSVFARFAFDAVQTWGTILLLSLVFAVVALLTYRFVHASAAPSARP